MVDSNLRPDRKVVRCDNRECDEEFRVRPLDDAEDYYDVLIPDSEVIGDRYCSPRCVARSMAQEPGVSRVNVYDEK